MTRPDLCISSQEVIARRLESSTALVDPLAAHSVAYAGLAALADAGFAVVRLPEPEYTYRHSTCDGEVTVWTWPAGVLSDDDTKCVHDDNGIEIGTPEESRAYAADILAAAKYAEGNHE